MRIDLQLHSTYSDGYLTPRELVKFVADQGVKVAALTDHNTVGGLGEFKLACKDFKIKPIIGLELYVKYKHVKFNLLWFNFDYHNAELHQMLRATQIRRRSRVRSFLIKLNELGFKIDVNKIIDKYNHYLAINHVIDEICENKFNLQKIKKELKNTNIREEEIIRAYFYNKDIGKLHESYINIERILKLRKNIGGQLILNHPGKYNQLNKPFLLSLKKLGIDGIEILSPHHSLGAIMYAQFMAKELNFIMTGGSDFHKNEGGAVLLQNSFDYFHISSHKLKGIKKIIG